MSIQYTIGVLVPIWGDGAPPPPEERPIGRVAMTCEELGLRLVFATGVVGGQMSGWMVQDGCWVAVNDVPVDAVYDRYPDQTRPEQYATTLQQLSGVPLFNPPSFTELCRDKLALQSFMVDGGIAMPKVCGRREAFLAKLNDWGLAFVKPQFGSFGRGVVHVASEAELVSYLREANPHEPLLLQRAIVPPTGWRGICLRVLVQRDASGGWVFNPGVARTSGTDWVVNAARGADVVPAIDVLDEVGADALERLLRRISARIDKVPGANRVLEMGVDLVLDAHRRPVLIEINGRPRGRLAVLAKVDPERFADAHQQAMIRPFRRIADFLKNESLESIHD